MGTRQGVRDEGQCPVQGSLAASTLETAGRTGHFSAFDEMVLPSPWAGGFLW